MWGKAEGEPSRRGHSDRLEGVNYDMFESIVEAVTRYNKGDRGDCKCNSCKLRIRESLISSGNILLEGMGEDARFMWDKKTDKICWMKLPEQDEGAADD